MLETLVGDVIGVQAGLKDVIEQVERVAGTSTPVLLLGETGSGKEVVATILHERSRRRDAPLLRVNCGAIAGELLDSELFGHESGSFTGATKRRLGWFERAHGGTLLLDEVGELPLAAQVRLLRVVQEGTIQRVGGEQEVKVDVRLVAATHRDLPEMVERGEFRRDLWYRLAVFPIRLPTLRERPQDIPALTRHFARRAGEALSGVPLEPSAAQIEQLMHYRWPGNVRELRAVVERAALLGDGRRLEFEAALGISPHLEAEAVAISTLDEAIAAHIRRALAHTGGKIAGPGGAAELLGLHPNTLRSKMHKLQIHQK